MAVQGTGESRVRRWGSSTFGKLAMLAVLLLLLLIPLARITDLVQERAWRQEAVQGEIAASWGHAQVLMGPVLTVPYRVTRDEVKIETAMQPGGSGGPTLERTRKVERHRLHVLPAEIRWQGRVEPQVRNRGIFQVVVYEAHLSAEGVFELPGPEAFENGEGGTAEGQPGLGLGETPSSRTEADWQQASLALGIPDLRGLQARVDLRWGEETLSFLPGARGADFLEPGIHVPVPLSPARPAATGAETPRTESRRVPFSFDLVLRGSHEILFLPAGEETGLDLSSPWSSPAFSGAFLPGQRRLSEQGFTATWQVPYFGRSFPQIWSDGEVDPGQLAGSLFGVRLELPADAYQQTERSVKYSVLFIVLTFATFFLLELMSPGRLHAVQYLLVGFALCVFYVLLLALAEHLGFGLAYALAAVATVGLIAGYGGSILASRRRAGWLLTCLGSLYGYLYVLLRLESYALLLGALGLFAVLALIMGLTRRLDWHTLSFQPARVG